MSRAKYADATSAVVAAIALGDGCTVSLNGRALAAVDGYVVSLPGREKLLRDPGSREEIRSYIYDHVDVLSDPDLYVGAWEGPDGWVLDVSEHVQDRGLAKLLGLSRGQIAVWDVAAGQEITL